MTGTQITRKGWTIMMQAQFTGPSYFDLQTGKVRIFATEQDAKAALDSALQIWMNDLEEDELEENEGISARDALGEWVVPCTEYADGSLEVDENLDEDWLGWTYSAYDLFAIRSEWSSYEPA